MKPLEGKRILLTRAADQLAELDRIVRARGAVPIHFPCLACEPLKRQIARGIDMLDGIGDILFTSVNGVESVAGFLADEGSSLRKVCYGKRVAAVGGQTAAALEQRNVAVAITPDTASQAGLIEAYDRAGVPDRLLFFRAEEGSDLLARALIGQGTEVVTIHAYRTVCPVGDSEIIIEALKSDSIDAVLLGSTKTARHYLKRIGSLSLASRPLLVAISEQMAADARGVGLNVQVVAKRASFEDMLDALVAYYEANPS